MEQYLAALATGAHRILGRPLADTEAETFRKYMELLRKWNRVHRLVGSADPLWIVERLFLDSLVFLRILPVHIGAMLDLGSGAGLPGIPIKIVKPEVALTLIESRKKRASFLAAVIRGLGLERTRLICARAEQKADELGGTFDAVVLRCAGALATMMPLARRFASAEGIVVASGPPRRTEIPGVQWVEVSGTTPGASRRFAVSGAFIVKPETGVPYTDREPAQHSTDDEVSGARLSLNGGADSSQDDRRGQSEGWGR